MRSTIIVGALVLLFTASTAQGQSPCPVPSPAVSFGDGTYRVGVDIAPGTYTTPGPEAGGRCDWRRLSGFGGSLSDAIAMRTTDAGPLVVTIEPTDAGFETSGCSWQPA